MNPEFTFKRLEQQYQKALSKGYMFITLFDYYENQSVISNKTIVNRVDVDFSVKKVEYLLDIYERLAIRATFFIRLHAPEYNPFSFENYRIIKRIRDNGHEIGYHSEIVDQAAIWNEKAHECLERDITVLNEMFGVKVNGVASHGGFTGANNLDFWRVNTPADFGLKYEAYESSSHFNLFKRSFYISDSSWTYWKCYKNGELVHGDTRSFGDHLDHSHPLIYLLIHPDTYFVRHIYE